MCIRDRAKPSQVAVAELSTARRAELDAPGGLASRFEGLEIFDGQLPPADGVVLAVKPGDIEGVCRNLAGTGAKRVLSIAAGVTLSDLQSWCPGNCAVVRAMPNMPALVSTAATAIVGGSRSDPEDVEWAAGIMAVSYTHLDVYKRQTSRTTCKKSWYVATAAAKQTSTRSSNSRLAPKMTGSLPQKAARPAIDREYAGCR